MVNDTDLERQMLHVFLMQNCPNPPVSTRVIWTRKGDGTIIFQENKVGWEQSANSVHGVTLKMAKAAWGAMQSNLKWHQNSTCCLQMEVKLWMFFSLVLHLALRPGGDRAVFYLLWDQSSLEKAPVCGTDWEGRNKDMQWRWISITCAWINAL